jgi:hypothetical protein
LNNQRAVFTEIDIQLKKIRAFLKINQTSSIKEIFSEIKKCLGLKEKKHVIKLNEKLQTEKKNTFSRAFKVHNNSVVGYESVDLDSHFASQQ